MVFVYVVFRYLLQGGRCYLLIFSYYFTENMKKYARNLLYDKLHRGTVLVCIGLTLYGTVLLGDHFYNYYRYVKPKIEAAKQAAERELLSEGSSDRILKE